MWKYYALLSALFAAVTALLAKCGVKSVDSNLATAIRTTVILFLTWGIVLCSGSAGQLKSISWRGVIFLAGSGVATGLSWLFYFKAIQLGDISKVAPLDKLSVALVVLSGILFFHEKATWQLICGSSCILFGTLLLLHGK